MFLYLIWSIQALVHRLLEIDKHSDVMNLCWKFEEKKNCSILSLLNYYGTKWKQKTLLKLCREYFYPNFDSLYKLF